MAAVVDRVADRAQDKAVDRVPVKALDKAGALRPGVDKPGGRDAARGAAARR